MMKNVKTYEAFLLEVKGIHSIKKRIRVLADRFGELKGLGYGTSGIHEFGIEDFPSEKIDDKLGTSISRQWRLPRGTDEHLIGKAIRVASSRNDNSKIEEYSDFMYDLYAVLVRLNSELRDIKVSNDDEVEDLLRGIVSRFNTDDLRVYAEGGVRASTKSLQLRKRINKLEIDHRINFDWVPSEETVSEVEKHVRQLKHYN